MLTERLPSNRFDRKHLPRGAYALYRMLSASMHHNLNALFERFEHAGSIALGRPALDSDLLDLVFLAAIAAVESIRNLPKFADVDAEILARLQAEADSAMQAITAAKERASDALLDEHSALPAQSGN